jgi:hypothetical protein
MLSWAWALDVIPVPVRKRAGGRGKRPWYSNESNAMREKEGGNTLGCMRDGGKVVCPSGSVVNLHRILYCTLSVLSGPMHQNRHWSVHFLLQDGSKAIKMGLGILAAAVATLAVSAFAVKRAGRLRDGAATSDQAPGRGGWTPMQVLAHVTDFAEGVLFSVALGLAGGGQLHSILSHPQIIDSEAPQICQ